MDDRNTVEKLPMRAMDFESTQNDIERLESEALIHDNPFEDKTAGKPVSGIDPEFFNSRDGFGKLSGKSNHRGFQISEGKVNHEKQSL